MGFSAAKVREEKAYFFLQSPEAIMWETSRMGSGFPLPACSFYCLNALPTETQPSLTSSVFTNSIFPSIIHVSFALYDISLFHLRTSSIKRPFFASAHISEDLSSSAGVHLSTSGTSGSSLSHHNIPLCAAAVKCLVVMVTTPRKTGVLLTFAGLQKPVSNPGQVARFRCGLCVRGR